MPMKLRKWSLMVNFTGLDQQQKDRENRLPEIRLPYSRPEPMNLILRLHLRIFMGNLGRTI